MPIKVYKSVHTIGNSHPGGDRAGLLMVSNVSIPFWESRAEKLPTARGMAIQVMSFFHWIVWVFKNQFSVSMCSMIGI